MFRITKVEYPSLIEKIDANTTHVSYIIESENETPSDHNKYVDQESARIIDEFSNVVKPTADRFFLYESSRAIVIKDIKQWSHKLVTLLQFSCDRLTSFKH